MPVLQGEWLKSSWYSCNWQVSKSGTQDPNVATGIGLVLSSLRLP